MKLRTPQVHTHTTSKNSTSPCTYQSKMHIPHLRTPQVHADIKAKIHIQHPRTPQVHPGKQSKMTK